MALPIVWRCGNRDQRNQFKYWLDSCVIRTFNVIEKSHSTIDSVEGRMYVAWNVDCDVDFLSRIAIKTTERGCNYGYQNDWDFQ